MQIKTNENGNIIQSANVGEIPGAVEIDLSMYKLVDGNLIYDTDKALMMYNIDRIKEIKARLSQIDSQSIRPLRAVLTGISNDFDREKLTGLEDEAIKLRVELKDLVTHGQ